MAVKDIAVHYQETHSDWSKEAMEDAESMREGMDLYRTVISPEETAYAYSSSRGWIPFGWFSHSPEILSMASTCWVMFVDAKFNPFDFPALN